MERVMIQERQHLNWEGPRHEGFRARGGGRTSIGDAVGDKRPAVGDKQPAIRDAVGDK